MRYIHRIDKGFSIGVSVPDPGFIVLTACYLSPKDKNFNRRLARSILHGRTIKYVTTNESTNTSHGFLCNDFSITEFEAHRRVRELIDQGIELNPACPKDQVKTLNLQEIQAKF